MNKRGLISANSASFCDKSGRLLPALVNEPLVLFPRSQLHNPDFSSKILEFASCNRNAESALDSAKSQNLVQNNRARSAHLESRPLRGAKNRNQASSSASADFLLEAEKRGSPPKSEKAAAFWRVGGAGRGVQPFCEKEKSSNESAESRLDFVESQNLVKKRRHKTNLRHLI